MYTPALQSSEEALQGGIVVPSPNSILAGPDAMSFQQCLVFLADQAKTNDFKQFGDVMTKKSRAGSSTSPTSCIWRFTQGVSGSEEWQNAYRDFSPDFFDLVVIDGDSHRGSAAADSAWREVLDYFSFGRPNRADSHAQRDGVRLQYRLLRRAGLHLLAACRGSTTAFWPPTRCCASTWTRTSTAGCRSRARPTSTAM